MLFERNTMRKNTSIVLLIFGIVLFLTIFFINPSKSEPLNEPLVITEYGSHRQLSIDEKIAEAEVIVIGDVKTVLPSRWDSINGKRPEVITSKSIFEDDLSIFTDTLFLIQDVLKGDIKEKDVLRVRSFSGEIDDVKWEDRSQPSFKDKQIFLLFLKQNKGPTSNIDPGAYMSINGISAVYSVSGGIATSIDDTWSLIELTIYIQKVLSEPTQIPTATITPEIIISESVTSIPAEIITPTP